MATHTNEVFNCDRCSKKLRTIDNQMDIVTSLSERSYWSRLHVRIQHHSGVHNDGELREADLCRDCAIFLLKDALKRVQNGERASKGTESSDLEKWE
jgi:hypothetical protein